MTTSVRAAGHQSPHILLQTLYVVWGVLHVIPAVVRIGLSILHALLIGACRSGMRAGVIDGLPVLQQFDRLVDPCDLRTLSSNRRDTRYECCECEGASRHFKFFLHGILLQRLSSKFFARPFESTLLPAT